MHVTFEQAERAIEAAIRESKKSVPRCVSP